MITPIEVLVQVYIKGMLKEDEAGSGSMVQLLSWLDYFLDGDVIYALTHVLLNPGWPEASNTHNS